MKELLKKHENKVLFVLVGGTNTVIDFGILFLLHGLGLNKYIANIISTLIAFIFSFFANRHFTFKSKKDARKQIIPFTVVTLSGLWILQPIIIWLILIPPHAIDQNIALFIAKLAATVVSLVWNYILYSRFVFK